MYMHSCTDNLELLIKVTTMARMQSHTKIVRFVMNFGCVIIKLAIYVAIVLLGSCSFC